MGLESSHLAFVGPPFPAYMARFSATAGCHFSGDLVACLSTAIIVQGLEVNYVTYQALPAFTYCKQQKAGRGPGNEAKR